LPIPVRDDHSQPMSRRPVRARAYAPDPAAPGRCCDLPGCGAPGEYRAPKSRRNLREYWWFCLEHVRAYNSTWDYYKGMSPAEFEQELRSDTAWQRPSWPLGRLGSAAWEDEVLRDPLHILASAGANKPRPRNGTDAPADLREPLSTFGLSWPTTLDAVKSRYKELAKRHHPDANGGSRDAEERLKTINVAYATLRSRLVAEPRLASAG
jgi:DnaJ domain